MPNDPIIHIDAAGKAWQLSNARAHLEACAGESPASAVPAQVDGLQATLDQHWAFMRQLLDAEIKVLRADGRPSFEVWTMGWDHQGPQVTPRALHMFVIIGEPLAPWAVIHDRIGREFHHVIQEYAAKGWPLPGHAGRRHM